MAFLIAIWIVGVLWGCAMGQTLIGRPDKAFSLNNNINFKFTIYERRK